ncbi:hypothetical protein [Flavobacterium aurantiibacter]|nr:hypothetical protein [Flavobacterium aurantiibacter]
MINQYCTFFVFVINSNKNYAKKLMVLIPLKNVVIGDTGNPLEKK